MNLKTLRYFDEKKIKKAQGQLKENISMIANRIKKKEPMHNHFMLKIKEIES